MYRQYLLGGDLSVLIVFAPLAPAPMPVKTLHMIIPETAVACTGRTQVPSRSSLAVDRMGSWRPALSLPCTQRVTPFPVTPLGASYLDPDSTSNYNHTRKAR